mgnify:CR=1 FL=1
MEVRAKLDDEYWIMQEGDAFVIVPALVARSTNRRFTIPGAIDPPPFAILRAGTVVSVEIDPCLG